MNSAQLIWAFGQVCFGCASRIITWRTATSYDVEFVYNHAIVRRVLQCDHKGRLYVNYKHKRVYVQRDLLSKGIAVDAVRID